MLGTQPQIVTYFLTMEGHGFIWQSYGLPQWVSFKNHNNHCIKKRAYGIFLFGVHFNFFFNCCEILELSIQCK